MMMIKQQV